MAKHKNEKKKPRIETFCKLITFLVITHGMACVTASYVLAFLNHTAVENLSITIVSQIVAPCSLYIICNLLANIFEKNQLKISTPLSAIQAGIVAPQYTASVDTTPASISPDNPMDLDLTNDFEMETSSGKGDDEI